MPLTIPNRKAVTDALRNFVRGELPELDASTERRSFVGGLVKSLGSLMADWYIALKRFADHEPFPQTATGSFLTRGWWRDLTKLSPNPASPAHGYLAITGTPGTIVNAGSEFTGNGSVLFRAMTSATIFNQSQNIASLIFDAASGICIAQTPNPHFLATGMQVIVSGAIQTEYNGEVEITVTDDSEFVYTPASPPGVTPATGSPKLAATFATLKVEATTSGQATNQDGNSTVALSAAPSGADSTALVTFGGLTGGADAETNDEYRARVLEALGTDFGMFSAPEIMIVAKQVSGVTRVFVRTAQLEPAPGWPQEGQVKIAFLRDNDANPLPSAQEVADVRNRILALELPSHTAAEDVIVMSPPPFTVNFVFQSITPDTPGMRRAVIAALSQFFREEADWGGAIAALDYECAIKSAYDLETRQRLKSFVLTSPNDDLIPGTTVGFDVDDYPVLGTVTFTN